MKKLFSILLTVVLLLALSTTAFATNVTITEPTGAEDAAYEGFKILNSTNSADNTDLFAYTLNEKYAAILKEVTGKDTEADIIAYIADLDADEMRAFANDMYVSIKKDIQLADATLATGDNTLGEGYWLIAQTSDAEELETQSLVIVDTVGKDEVTVESKKDIFTVDKTVTDESQFTCTKDQETIKDADGKDVANPEYKPGHTHTAACYDWTKTNESPVGATVKFKIETKVPANMAGYKYNAYFIVGDTLGEGLTLDEDSIEVYIDGTKAAAATDYTVRFEDGTTPCEEGYTFQVALVDPKAEAGNDVVVYYSAMVNEDAKLKTTGNPNEADVTYNPDDNEKYGGDPEEGETPDGFPKDEDSAPEGKSPKTFTLTFATGIEFRKVDGNGKALDGAAFTVTGTTETTELIWKQDFNKVETGKEGTGTYYLLNNGDYTEEAPVTEDTMVAQTKGDAFEGGYVPAADTDPKADTDKTLGTTRYREATQDDFEDDDTTIYTFVKANTDKYKETVPNYTYKEGWTEQTATKDLKVKVAVDENGIANLPGLAAGTYTVTESVVPAGYNKIDDFQIKIEWTAPEEDDLKADGENAECTWTATLLDKDGKVMKDDQGNDKTLSLTTVNTLWDLFATQVVNEAGTELPSTGGMGTYVFYVVGGILLLGAAILLITKKRMSAGK